MRRCIPALTLLMACGESEAPAPAAEAGIAVQLQGDPTLAQADAAAMTQRLREMGVTGTVRATDAGITVTLGEGADAGPVVAELIRPARFAIRPEVVEGGEETRACPPGTGDCGTIRLGPAALDNAALQDARVDTAASTPTIALTLTEAAAASFADLTREQVGQRLAITVDGLVLTAPTVMESIPGGRVQLTLAAGTPTTDAAALATALRTPPLQGTWLIAPER